MRRPARLVSALLLLLVATRAEGEPAPIAATSLPLAHNMPAGSAVGPLVFRGALDLTSRDRRFGGLSGLHVSADGHVISVSDNGYFVEFDLVETASGDLEGVSGGSIEVMRNPGNRPFTSNADRDAEELIVLPDGERLVVFEHNVRLGRFPRGSATASRFEPLPAAIPRTNKAAEAAVMLADGRLLLFAERLGAEEGVRRGWLGRPGGPWQTLDYVPPTNDDVSGAALLPNGDLVVLERDFGGLVGFRCRLVVVPGKMLRPGARLEGKEILRLAPPYLSDNFEGVAVREAGGRTELYLVSDDNYLFLQRTLLLKFELPR